MMRKDIVNLTLEDIGRLAGVSRSTVSRVINNQPNVKGDVRARVLDGGGPPTGLG